MRLQFCRKKVWLLCVLVALLSARLSIGVPNPPSSITATSENANVSLTWSSVSGATTFSTNPSASTTPDFLLSFSPVSRAVSQGKGSTYTAKVTPTNGFNGTVTLRATGLPAGVSATFVPATITSSGSGIVNVFTTAATAPGSYTITVSGVSGSLSHTATAELSVSHAASESTALPEAFFSLTYTHIDASHYPTVPFGSVRLWDTNTSWAQIETSRGTYNWTDLDIWLKNIKSHGQDAMYTFGFVPTWASSEPSQACAYEVSIPGCAAPPSDLNSGDTFWKEFVTAVVKHSLSSSDLHIASYEMWNEPDLKRDWTGTPAQLVQMVKEAYAIIHELDPSAKVVGPTPSTANQYGVHFLPSYYAAGGADAQDIVGIHAYVFNGSDFASDPSGIMTSISQLQKLMATYGISSKPIWFTEGSWAGSTINAPALTDAQKAAWLAQEYMLTWSTGAVSRYYWYAWDANLGTLWTPSGGLTQPGIAYDQLAGWLIGSTHASNPCTEDSTGTHSCLLTLSSGYPAEIIWNANISKTITVDASFLTSKTLANSTVHSISNHEVAIGPLPVLVIKGQAQ